MPPKWFTVNIGSSEQLDAIHATLTQLVREVQKLNANISGIDQTGASIMAGLEEVAAAVAEQQTISASVAAAIEGIAQQVDELEAQLATAGVDPAEVTALAASIRANSQVLVDAVEANVPPHVELQE